MVKVGLVLSGALSKGAYQLGFLRALEEKTDCSQIKMVSGTSVGACNGYAFVTGKLDVMEDLWMNTDLSNMFKMWGSVVFKGLIKSHLKKLMEEGDYIHTPLIISSLQIFPWWKFRYIEYTKSYEPHWKKIMNGAIGFPILTGMPKIHKGKIYLDGGIVDNIPYQPLITHDLDIILVLHFDAKFKVDLRKVQGKVFIDLDISSRVIDGNKKSFNFSKANITKMKQIGYQYGIEILDRLLQHDNLEDLRVEAAHIREEERLLRQRKKTLDTWPTRLNRLFKKSRFKKDIIKSIDEYK